MIHQVTINDSTTEGKLILEVIKAMKPSKKSVKISSADFSFERLGLGQGKPLTEEEMELLAQEAEKSKGISLTAFDKKMRKKLAAHASRVKKAA